GPFLVHLGGRLAGNGRRMIPGEALTRWSVRVALALYAAGLVGLLLGKGRAARWAWTAGCLAFLAHVACAFHYFHGWSQPSAFVETARRTAELFGLRWGGGLYLNYLFTLLWPADVAWWWLDPAGHARRPRWLSVALHAFFAFLAFNATVVFETGPVR